MITFKGKDYYEIQVDKAKNCISLTIRGHLTSPSQIPDFRDHTQQAIAALKKGYTLLVDLSSQSKAPKFSLTKVLKENQKMYIAGGVSKTAVILAPHLLLPKLTLQAVTKLSGMNLKVFREKSEAEAWLKEK